MSRLSKVFKPVDYIEELNPAELEEGWLLTVSVIMSIV